MFSTKCLCSAPCTCRSAKDWALLALRIALGVVFILHGYDKLFGGMEGFIGMVGRLGFPAPAFFAYAAALTEFVGGIAILLGAFTTVASGLMVIVMLVAIFGAKGFKFPMIDADVALLAMAVAIGLMGPGRFSLAALVSKSDMSGTDVIDGAKSKKK